MKKSIGFGVAALALSGVAGADILMDQTGMVGALAYDAGNGSAIAGMGVFGIIYDLNLSDEFTIGAAYDITHVQTNVVTFLGTGFAGGLLVEFFADGGGFPVEVPSAAALIAPADITETPFVDGIFGLSGLTIDADTSTYGLSLGAGTWWASLTPVDETAAGDWAFTVRDLDVLTGADSHGRDGGGDHGNGYAGGYGFPDWTSFGFMGFGAGDSALLVEGTLVPAPGAIALLGLAGLVSSRRRRA